MHQPDGVQGVRIAELRPCSSETDNEHPSGLPILFSPDPPPMQIRNVINLDKGLTSLVMGGLVLA